VDIVEVLMKNGANVNEKDVILLLLRILEGKRRRKERKGEIA